MSKIMFQFQHPGRSPTPAEVARKYGFKPDEIDQEYGVVAIDRKRSLYVVQVDDTTRSRVEETLRERGAFGEEGFFSNPRIEPFGPPT